MGGSGDALMKVLQLTQQMLEKLERKPMAEPRPSRIDLQNMTLDELAEFTRKWNEIMADGEAEHQKVIFQPAPSFLQDMTPSEIAKRAIEKAAEAGPFQTPTECFTASLEKAREDILRKEGAEMERRRRIRCRYCDQKNDAARKHCEYCGAPLSD